MKQKITTIGLLVFFIGILVTACGKKKDNNGGTQSCHYNGFGEVRYCNGKRSVDLSGRLHINNPEGYAQAFIGEIGDSIDTDYAGRPVYDINDPNLGNDIANIFLNALIGNALIPVAHCGSAKIGGDVLKGLGYDDVRVGCAFIRRNRDAYDDLRDNYYADLRFEFDDRTEGNGIRSVTVTVRRGSSRDTIDFDYRQSDYVFDGRSRTGEDITLEISGSRIDLISRSHGRIGYIEKL